MKVVILSAGVSSRIRPLTDDCPKYLLRIGAKTLGEYQLDAVTSVVGVDKIVIVVGYRGEMIRARIGDRYNGVEISYIDNPLYEHTEMNYSLYLAKEEIVNQPFIFLAGDTVFHPDILTDLVENEFGNCMVIDKVCQSQNVDALVTGYNGQLVSLCGGINGDLSHRAKTLKDLVGEPLMMIKFDSNYGTYLINAIEKNGFAKGAKHLMYVFADTFPQYGMNYFQIDNIPWIEVDYFEDVNKAEEVCRRIWTLTDKKVFY